MSDSLRCQAKIAAAKALAQLDGAGRPLTVADWVAMLEEVLEGVTSRLDAAREDLRDGK